MFDIRRKRWKRNKNLFNSFYTSSYCAAYTTRKWERKKARRGLEVEHLAMCWWNSNRRALTPTRHKEISDPRKCTHNKRRSYWLRRTLCVTIGNVILLSHRPEKTTKHNRFFLTWFVDQQQPKYVASRDFTIIQCYLETSGIHKTVFTRLPLPGSTTTSSRFNVNHNDRSI